MENNWVDEEDKEIQIDLNAKNKLRKLKKEGKGVISGAEFQERLREQFVKMNSQSDIYKWATEEPTDVSDSGKNDNLSELLRTNKRITEKEDVSNAFTNVLKLQQIPDLNKEDFHSSIVSAVEFSPVKDYIAFTAGLDKKLKLYSINEDKEHTLIHSINTLDMPIFSARFLRQGNEIILSGRRKHFFVFNLETNKLDRCPSIFAHKDISLEKMFLGSDYFCFSSKDGYILLHDVKSKKYRYELKINGSVNSVCFDRNDLNLYAVGSQSEIYVFDLRKVNTCVNKVNDSGNFATNCMDISLDNGYLATGSNSGYVNLYTVDSIRNATSQTVEPVKVIENLTTSCEFIRFDKSSSKLGICSRWKKHGFKMVRILL
jgi:U3 small nucleolar RNA-associated protein 18